jgi:hypothetical protein
MSANKIMMSEAEAIELLSRKVADEGFLTVPQVSNGTGAIARRTADAILVQTWPSRGLSLTGVEYKRTRYDWRRELREGSKAEPVAAYCHFWLVLAPKGVVPVGEIPAGWGLWEFDERERLLRTKAPPIQNTVKDLDLGFLSAILRSSEKKHRNSTTLAADRRQLEADFDKRIDEAVKHRTRFQADLEKKVQDFEQASGIEIRHGWSHEKLGEGLRKYLSNPDRFVERLKMDKADLERILTMLNEILEARP